MEVAFVSNLRAPYRTLQLNEFSKINDFKLTAYYTNHYIDNRDWDTNKNVGFKEIDLKGKKILGGIGYLNEGLVSIVKKSDLIILGGYDQPSNIFLSILCKIYKKPYILLIDGVSSTKIDEIEKFIKKHIKKNIIKNASSIMANGTLAKRYLNEKFDYPIEKIYNQYLSVDNEMINRLYDSKSMYRKMYRKKFNIKDDEKVVLYSGRLIELKNVESIILSISRIKRKNIVLLIIGGGELENHLILLANKMGVKVIITGFIFDQEDLFKHYFAGDIFILPSLNEVWGLVVNEAMMAGLPVIVSNICGCSADLVKNENGYLIEPLDIEDIKRKIEMLLFVDNYKLKGNASREIIKSWNFGKSKENLKRILKKIEMIS